MEYLICYDITENKIRTKVMKYLESFAWRLQYSVFRCESTERRMEKVKHRLSLITANSKKCMIIITPLCGTCQSKIWSIGSALEEAPKCVVV